jgi:hypothetical protein
MWICPKCETHVDPSFDVCWACGTSADGVEDPSFVTADEAEPIYDRPPEFDAKPDTTPGEELPEPPLELLECYRARDAAEAKFLVDRLADQGIAAVANGVHMSNAEYLLPQFSPRVMVRSDDFPRARAFVQDYEKRKKHRSGQEDLA